MQETALEQPRASWPSSARQIGSALAPHAIYTVSEELLRWTAELAAEREIPVQIHLSETEDEVERLPRAARRCARPPTSTASGC